MRALPAIAIAAIAASLPCHASTIMTATPRLKAEIVNVADLALSVASVPAPGAAPAKKLRTTREETQPRDALMVDVGDLSLGFRRDGDNVIKPDMYLRQGAWRLRGKVMGDINDLEFGGVVLRAGRRFTFDPFAGNDKQLRFAPVP